MNLSGYANGENPCILWGKTIYDKTPDCKPSRNLIICLTYMFMHTNPLTTPSALANLQTSPNPPALALPFGSGGQFGNERGFSDCQLGLLPYHSPHGGSQSSLRAGCDPSDRRGVVPPGTHRVGLSCLLGWDTSQDHTATADWGG